MTPLVAAMQRFEGQTFRDAGRTYDVSRLWELTAKNPTVKMSVAKLHKEVGKTWGHRPNKYGLDDVLANPKLYSKDYTRILRADLNYPILIHKGWIIADGVHRLGKAMLNKQRTILARLITKEQMRQAQIKGRAFASIKGPKFAQLEESLSSGEVRVANPVRERLDYLKETKKIARKASRKFADELISTQGEWKAMFRARWKGSASLWKSTPEYRAGSKVLLAILRQFQSDWTVSVQRRLTQLLYWMITYKPQDSAAKRKKELRNVAFNMYWMDDSIYVPKEQMKKSEVKRSKKMAKVLR